jgi:hypothetical protein
MSKFSDFVAEKKLDLRRIRYASKEIERLRPEDRALRLAHRLNKGKEKKEERKAKPRSGRPVTERSLNAAMAGNALSGPQKTRLLRAVNRLLEQKKQEVATLSALF